MGRDHAGSRDALCPINGGSGPRNDGGRQFGPDDVARSGRDLDWHRGALVGLAPAAPARPEGAETDRRFDAPEWEQHPFFRLLKQSYLALSKQLLEEAERQAVDPDERQRLVFHLRQFLDAISPTTFLPTNPAALRKAWETGGSSVADGLRNLLDDLRQGQLSMTDTAAFAPGKNLATTPGKVVYRNRLIELIHYAPMTTQTYAVPLLFIPPWINKFYVLDLQPKNSLVRFLLEQGFSVFMISDLGDQAHHTRR